MVFRVRRGLATERIGVSLQGDLVCFLCLGLDFVLDVLTCALIQQRGVRVPFPDIGIVVTQCVEKERLDRRPFGPYLPSWLLLRGVPDRLSEIL